QVAFDLVVAVDGFTNLEHLSVGKLVHAAVRRNADLVDNLLGKLLADAVNVLKRDDHALIGRNVDAGYTSHILSFSIWAGLPPKTRLARHTSFPASGGGRPLREFRIQNAAIARKNEQASC